MARVALLSACAIAFPVLAQASTTSDPVWRASSRLGYGPTEELVADVARMGGARAWALHQVDVAYALSQQPANIPAQMEHFNRPLEEIFQEFEKERQARKAVLFAPSQGFWSIRAQGIVPARRR